MIENFFNLFQNFSNIDIIFLCFLFANALLSLSKGFVLSFLSFLKWIFALIATKFFLPLLSSYTKHLIDSELTHDIIFGSLIFLISIFLIILISKGLKKTISLTGFGSVDNCFGFIFGFLKGYVYFIIIFSFINFFYPYKIWKSSFNTGKFFNSIILGQNFLEENISKRHEYIDKSRENMDKINK